MSIHRIDSSVGRAEKTAAGTRVPVYTGAGPELKVEILHGLGRIPTGIRIGDKDRWCDFYTVSKDKDRHIAVFREAKVNLYMEYE